MTAIRCWAREKQGIRPGSSVFGFNFTLGNSVPWPGLFRGSVSLQHLGGTNEFGPPARPGRRKKRTRVGPGKASLVSTCDADE